MNTIQDNDISFLENEKSLSLFYFTASWCGPCKRIYPLIDKLSQGLDSSKIKIYKVDIDENDEISEKYEIQSVPTFVLIKDSENIDSCSGADIEKVRELLKNNL
tara:strand:+ start:389 stop:700 length:312 start_codon:yes stop_codon:yes gene_type:complete